MKTGVLKQLRAALFRGFWSDLLCWLSLLLLLFDLGNRVLSDRLPHSLLAFGRGAINTWEHTTVERPLLGREHGQGLGINFGIGSQGNGVTSDVRVVHLLGLATIIVYLLEAEDCKVETFPYVGIAT